MTDKQIDKVIARIAKLKKELADDKRKWGGEHHDGRGIRYVITEQYLKIQDYKGGLKYLNWFDKYFPDDSGYPIFLFESAFILFKCNKLKDAEKKVHRTFFSNTYLLDKFLGNEPLRIEKNESSNWENESWLKYFYYSSKSPEFSEFVIWLNEILNSRSFLDKANEFIEIEVKLISEQVGPARTKLVNRLFEIRYD